MATSSSSPASMESSKTTQPPCPSDSLPYTMYMDVFEEFTKLYTLVQLKDFKDGAFKDKFDESVELLDMLEELRKSELLDPTEQDTIQVQAREVGDLLKKLKAGKQVSYKEIVKLGVSVNEQLAATFAADLKKRDVDTVTERLDEVGLDDAEPENANRKDSNGDGGGREETVYPDEDEYSDYEEEEYDASDCEFHGRQAQDDMYLGRGAENI